MAVHLRGNLCLKSGPLAPVASKLLTQHLVIDHMNCHYTKIDKAKTSIDTSPPKSLTTSQKMRDTLSRNYILNSPQLSYVHMNELDSLPNNGPSGVEIRAFHSMMRSTPLDKPRDNNNVTSWSSPWETHVSRPGEPDHFKSQDGTSVFRHVATALPTSPDRPLISSISCMAIHNHDTLKRTYSGDVLDRRSHLFTEPDGPFTPRTLKTSHESLLKHSKFYNPPLPEETVVREDEKDGENQRLQPSQHKYKYKKVIVQDKVSFGQQKDISLRKDNLKQGKLREGKLREGNLREGNLREINLREGNLSNLREGNLREGNLREGNLREGNLREGNLREGNLREGNLREGNLRQDTEETSGVYEDKFMNTALGSHSDSFHHKVSYNVPPLAISKDKDHINWLREQASKAEARVRDSRRRKSLQQAPNQPSSGRRSGLGEAIKMELQRRDEENKYLAFAKHATDDVVSRGICSDSGLFRVFDNHIERRRCDLDVKRMRSVIRDVCRSIGLESYAGRQEP